MKKQLWKRVALVFAVVLPVALFFIAREASSWRAKHQFTLSLGPGGAAKGGAVDNARVAPDGQRIAVQVSDAWQTWVTVWNLKSQKADYKVPIQTDGNIQSHSYALSHRGALVAVVNLPPNAQRFRGRIISSKGEIKLQPALTRLQVDDTPRELHFSPDDREVWLASTFNVWVWNAQNGHFKRQLWKTNVHPKSPVSDATLSPDLKYYARSSYGKFTMWDAKTARAVHQPSAGVGIKFSPDGKRILYRTGMFVVCDDIASGETLWTATPLRRCRDVLWSSDGQECYVFRLRYIEVRSARDGTLIRQIAISSDVTVAAADTNSSQMWLFDFFGNVFRQRLR